MAFGKAIRDCRKQLGISQKELAERAGIDFTYLSKIENNRTPPPSEDVIRAMAQVLGVDSDELIRLESGLPVVVVDHSAPDVGLPTVVPDNFSGAYEATRHLLELGHERIGFIRGPSKYWTLGERMSGYLLAMQQRGLPLDPSLIPPRISHGEQKGYGEMQLLLDLSDRPTAVFAVSDKTAMGAYQAAADRGLSIPDDVSVVGFDDIESARAMTPPLTTVHVSGDILGRVAIKRLAGILNDRTAGEQMSVKWTIPTKLVIRESTTPPPSSSCHREGADGGKTRLFEVCCAE